MAVGRLSRHGSVYVRVDEWKRTIVTVCRLPNHTMLLPVYARFANRIGRLFQVELLDVMSPHSLTVAQPLCTASLLCHQAALHSPVAWFHHWLSDCITGCLVAPSQPGCMTTGIVQLSHHQAVSLCVYIHLEFRGPPPSSYSSI